MSKLVEFLEEYKQDKQDEQIITDFKEKLNISIEYKQHLANFEFDKKWFVEIDRILIELGYRALDADISYIKTELKRLIKNTHINKIIDFYNAIYGATYTKQNFICEKNTGNIRVFDMIEHIEYVIENCHYRIDWDLFSELENDTAVRYCLKNIDYISWKYFSQNASDLAVDYLLEHPDKIVVECAISNTNEKMIRYCQKNVDIEIFRRNEYSANDADLAVDFMIAHPETISLETFSLNKNIKAIEFLPQIVNDFTNDEIIICVLTSEYAVINNDIAVKCMLDLLHKFNSGEYDRTIDNGDIDEMAIDMNMFPRNEHVDAVRYCIEHINEVDLFELSRNASKFAVEYFIQNQKKIDWCGFSQNKSDLAVDYLIKNPKKIRWMYFSRNENPHAVNYCINHPKKINWNSFNINEADLAVDYCIQHIDKINLNDFMENENFKIVDYFLRLEKNINWLYTGFPVEENILKIAKWKLQTFDSMNLLPMSGMKLN